jgi:outer membrane protein assembly factor BamB
MSLAFSARRIMLIAVLVAAATSALAAETVGWRTDGTGRYPTATPVLQWGPDENVRWKTALPGTGNGTPILVGNRIFLCAEPSTLVCVDATDGRLLWQKTNSYEDIASAEDLARIGPDQAKTKAIEGEFNKATREVNQAKAGLQSKPDDEALKTKLAAAQAKQTAIGLELEPYRKLWYTFPPRHDINGYSSATPVSDGRYVWVVFGTGIVACYDLEGNRQWAKFIEKPTDMWGHSASPVVVGDKLIVHISQFTALDKTTGARLWQTRTGASWGTHLPTAIGGTQVIVTPKGEILRVDDGVVLAKGIGGLEYASPILDGRIAYFIENGGKAVELPEAVVENKVVCRKLWNTQPKKDRYYASPVLHEGLLYAVTQVGVFSCIDAATGEVVYEQNLGLGKAVCYPSVTFAGGHLFVAGDNGTTVVVTPGRTYSEVGRNKIEPYRGSLVFDGDRLFLRGFQNLYCIGAVN